VPDRENLAERLAVILKLRQYCLFGCLWLIGLLDWQSKLVLNPNTIFKKCVYLDKWKTGEV
jgi:hypothetical protein